ncbi:MAG: phage baseplate assembly protein V [Methylophagaceae bacterium]
MAQSKRTNLKKLTNIGPGPFEAIVVSNLDTTYMGTLKVDILKNNASGSLPEKLGTSIEVRYLSPFYGVTNPAHTTNNDGYAATQKSYGMWFVPPDVGARVLVTFAEGDIANGFWIGCVQDKFMNFMVPDGRASTTLTTPQTPDNVQGLKIPVGEYNKKTEKGNGRDPTRYNKPYNKDFTQSLEIQGLIRDENRGTTSSSARREVPSSVFGISTPGPIDKRQGAPKGLVGEAGLKHSKFVNRLGGSSFVMDDGDDTLLRVTHPSAGPPTYANVEAGQLFGQSTIPHNEVMRFRTRTGHQILMHNSEDFIYIANSRGTAWVELTSDGKIDVYGLDSISIHSDADINLTADRDVNIEGGRNVNMRASGRYDNFATGGEVKIESQSNTTLRAETNMFVDVAQDQDIKIGGIQKTLVTGDIHHHTNANLYILADVEGHIKAGTNMLINSTETLNLVGEASYLTSTAGAININATGGNVEVDGGTDVNLNSTTSSAGTAATDATDATDAIPLPKWTVPKTSPGTLVPSDVSTFVKRMPSHEPYAHHENLDPVMVKSERTSIDNTVALPNAPLLSSADTFRKSFSGGTTSAGAGEGAAPGTSGVNPLAAGQTGARDDKALAQKFSSVGADGNILDVIGFAEGAGYNTPYNGSNITPVQLYGKQLSELTLDEVFTWQAASVNAGSASSAAGKYQIINKTLKGLVDGAGVVSREDKFSPANQDKLCRKLLQQRGVDGFMAGSKSEASFCLAMAQEWASLPVIQRTQGQKRKVNPGESYYAGDGLNKSRIAPIQLIAAVREVKKSGYA